MDVARLLAQMTVTDLGAGHSSMVFDAGESLDDLAARLDRVGIAHGGVQDASSTRILAMTDPDGNRIVFTGPFA